LNTATNRYQLQIKDGSDRNNTLTTSPGLTATVT